MKKVGRLFFLGLVAHASATGCGQGIALEPSSRQTPDTDGADGGDAAANAADASDGVTDMRRIDGDSGGADAPSPDAQDAHGQADRGTGAADADDVDAEAVGDASMDARGDFSVDSAGDASLEGGGGMVRDSTGDPSDDSIDVRFDVIDARGASIDTADAGDASSDAMRDAAQHIDAADANDGCTVACWPAADYYVDASAPAGGNGSKLQPFKTITLAIAAYALSPGVAKKAYVAPGTYDEALGERFPLVLRGLSLEGAGADRTFVIGVGDLDHTGQGGIYSDHYTVTMAVGDRLLPTNITGLSVQSPSPVPAEEFLGILCDQGNATDEVASPNGKTHLDDVTVGPGYLVNMAVTTSTLPSITGCNMLITRSTITGGVAGINAAGCDGTALDAAVILEMGTDDPASGNTVSWMQSTSGIAYGIRLQDCVMRSSFRYNTISDSSVGVVVNGGVSFPADVQPHTSFTHNSFERIGWMGLLLSLDNLFVDEVSDNRFVGNTRPLNGAFLEASRALIIDYMPPGMGPVRRNQFIGNDVGLELSLRQDQPAPDFGTVSDPGNNEFRCNSGVYEVGADVVVLSDLVDWSGTVRFAGNAWDHAPPTVQVGSPAPNGSDIAVPSDTPNLNVDRRNATVSTAACPNGRVPGQ
jgi:hypothetical protein